MSRSWLMTLSMLIFVAVARGEDWPQFRGVNGSGVSGSRSLPVHFSHKDKVLWQIKLGEGVSSPIVAGGRVFTTEMTPSQRFVVSCHEAASGKEMWRRELDMGPLPRITQPNSHASCTPATDGKRVYVHFSAVGLLAFDATSGAEVWRHPLPKPAYLMHWGASSSPIVHRDMVIFVMDDDLLPYVIAVDAATGKHRWKTLRPDMLAGYALPVMCEANGRTDLVVAGTGRLIGYDPSNGKELWTCKSLPRINMTSPVVKDGVVYVAVQSYGDPSRTLKFALLEWLDTNQDGKLARAEVPEEFRKKFDLSDRNKDGFLTGEEIDTAFQHPSNMVGGGSIIQAIKGGGHGDVTRTHLLWNRDKKIFPSNMSSPLVLGNRLYVVKKGGIGSCFDTATGKGMWEKKRIDNLGEYYASPVAADGKIYVAGQNGFVVVLADGPNQKTLARNDMGGRQIIATPAIADGRLFIRTADTLFCISNEAK
ncbi:MAG: serine/threonine protein kinase [Planctomycetes bacterium]|nr:serine/threonine protein kinase [Planctomycetota bacterium]